jgi:predicted ArsR family transcriptional regulator
MTETSSETLSDDLLAIMRTIREKGGTDCSGSCHHRKPGEFHCHVLGRDLGISSSGVKERILTLVRMGLLERHRLERPGTFPVTKFTISARGKEALKTQGNREEE